MLNIVVIASRLHAQRHAPLAGAAAAVVLPQRLLARYRLRPVRLTQGPLGNYVRTDAGWLLSSGQGVS
jgi:hypothetical protein